jgi:hypothetical protein
MSNNNFDQFILHQGTQIGSQIFDIQKTIPLHPKRMREFLNNMFPSEVLHNDFKHIVDYLKSVENSTQLSPIACFTSMLVLPGCQEKSKVLGNFFGQKMNNITKSLVTGPYKTAVKRHISLVSKRNYKHPVYLLVSIEGYMSLYNTHSAMKSIGNFVIHQWVHNIILNYSSYANSIGSDTCIDFTCLPTFKLQKTELTSNTPIRNTSFLNPEMLPRIIISDETPVESGGTITEIPVETPGDVSRVVVQETSGEVSRVVVQETPGEVSRVVVQETPGEVSRVVVQETPGEVSRVVVQETPQEPQTEPNIILNPLSFIESIINPLLSLPRLGGPMNSGSAQSEVERLINSFPDITNTTETDDPNIRLSPDGTYIIFGRNSYEASERVQNFLAGAGSTGIVRAIYNNPGTTDADTSDTNTAPTSAGNTLRNLPISRCLHYNNPGSSYVTLLNANYSMAIENAELKKLVYHLFKNSGTLPEDIKSTFRQAFLNDIMKDLTDSKVQGENILDGNIDEIIEKIVQEVSDENRINES